MKNGYIVQLLWLVMPALPWPIVIHGEALKIGAENVSNMDSPPSDASPPVCASPSPLVTLSSPSLKTHKFPCSIEPEPRREIRKMGQSVIKAAYLTSFFGTRLALSTHRRTIL
jgi:hypothetical protein